jgi:hypothetical protein
MSKLPSRKLNRGFGKNSGDIKATEEFFMKKTAGKIIFILVLVSLANTFIGCASNSVVKYSFAKNESETASITFLQNNETLRSDREDVYFIDLDGVSLPKPEKKTTWGNTIIFPVGVPLEIKVEVSWESKNVKGKKDGGHKKIVFECPPLKAGKEYQLKYVHETLGDFGFFGKIIEIMILGDRLVLTNISTGETIHEKSFKLISI